MYWLYNNRVAIEDGFIDKNIMYIIYIFILYLMSNILRMMRLVILTLDSRKFSISILQAHILTIIPNCLLPFKTGEILRIFTFIKIYDNHHKPIAVWIVERCSDLLMITIYIIILSLLNIKLPKEIIVIFMTFIIISILGLLFVLSSAVLLLYLKRHLVLRSISSRGLFLLKISHEIRLLVNQLQLTLEGRVPVLVLITGLIWSIEIYAYASAILNYNFEEMDTITIFSYGLLSSLPYGLNTTNVNIYQAITLVIISLIGIISFIFLKSNKKEYDK